MEQKPQIGVIGKGDALSEELRELAYQVGRAVAERGCVLINGGLGGVMGAAAKGAADAGGTSVGIVPSYERGHADPSNNIVIATGMGHARNAIVVASCDAVIAVSGELGTLSEIALARKLQVPVVGIDTWEGRSPAYGELDVTRASSAAEAAELAHKLATTRR